MLDILLKILIFFLLFQSCKPNNQNNDRQNTIQQNDRQKIKFEKYLKIIEESIISDTMIGADRVPEAIFYLERITDISSEADGTFIGKLFPTENDFKRWKEWYEKHYNVKWKPHTYRVPQPK
jgi:hypothetical protein